MDVTEFENSTWYQELAAAVRKELDNLIQADDAGQSALQDELDRIRRMKAGWQNSLGDPELPQSVRSEIQQNWAQANERQQELEDQLTARRNAQLCVDKLLSPPIVLDRLQRLPNILAFTNPSRCNLELGLHIDRIACDDTGKVVIRSCRLGALAEAVPLLRHDPPPAVAETTSESAERNSSRRGPRRRRRLRVDSVGSDRRELVGTAEFVADPNRYAGLPESWFCEDIFYKPEKLSWAAEHAIEVAQARLLRLTHEQLSVKFGKTIPTIRSAIEHAAEQDPSIGALLAALPRKMPLPQWHVEHAEEVWAYAEELKRVKGTKITPMKELMATFDMSDVTIRKALGIACERREAASD